MTREFHFSEGTSNKFWKITVEGNSFTVQWGRIGTAGQVQTKEFGGDAAAAQAADKLIQEKLKKGYQEQGGDGTAAPTPVAKVEPKAPPTPKAEPASAPPPAPAPAAPLNPDVERALHLDDYDYALVTYGRTQRPRPEAPPFDKEEALRRLGRVTRAYKNYTWLWDWDKAEIAPVLSPEEAAFWLEAMADSRFDRQPKEIVKNLAGQQSIKPKGLLPALKQLAGHYSSSPEAMKALGSLYAAEQIVDGILECYEALVTRQKASQVNYGVGPALANQCVGFGQWVAPYLSEAELEAIRETLRPQVLPRNWPALNPAGFYDPPPAAFFLAAVVGMHDELLRVVETWPDDGYILGEEWCDFYHRPQAVIFGLGSADLVEHHMRRMKLRVSTPQYIGAWLAHTQYGALDVLRDTILGEKNKESAEVYLDLFTCVQAPEAAPMMLELMLSSKAPQVARWWLNENTGHAIAGLAPVAAGRGKFADAAIEFLRGLKRKGGEEAIRKVLEQAPPDVRERVRAAVLDYQEAGGEAFDDASTPEWLKSAAAALAKKKAPAWLNPADLPGIAVGDHSLSEAQITAVLTALAASKPDEPDELIGLLKQHADRASLDRFAWSLFERWLSEGGPSKEKWAMQALGLLGGDASALKLTPMIRAWPGESQHQRAVTGLECLRTIGTDTALMQINGIAQKVPFKGIKSKAGECMEAIAKDRGLTRPQLEDRIVPDCDLDERGSRDFDFGSRSFRMVLGQGMKPMVREEDGKIRPDLPKPTQKDDAALAERATAEWKLLKKQVSEVAKVQSVRLEQAMVTGRRWPQDEFELLLVRHPLMTNLVRLLVWGAYDAAGKLGGTFRVTEDLTYAHSSDEAFEPDASHQIGVVHPLHLSEAEKAAWGEILGDYEIVPPFMQLGRPVHGLEGGEGAEKELNRWKKVEIPPQSLVFTLEKLGWDRGIPEDAGIFYSHTKPFYGTGVTAVVEYEQGVPVGYMEGWDDQKITRSYFIPGIWKPDYYPDHKNQLQLQKVDPVVISEVLSDLTLVASKGK